MRTKRLKKKIAKNKDPNFKDALLITPNFLLTLFLLISV